MLEVITIGIIIVIAIFSIFRWIFRKIKNGIGYAVDYVASGQMDADRQKRSAKNYQRRSRNLDKALKEGSVDHDTYVRAQIWLEKLRDF
jgi:ABC-type nickel/cobalt efflux system permease component RcnA